MNLTARAVCPVFRRESVWKVSMSVRLRPAVRCTFDENEGVLRVVLKEAQEREDASSDRRKEDVVVYALKVRAYSPC